MPEGFKKLASNISIKVHYHHSHLDKFQENPVSYSEEQWERFHQEERYQDRWDRHTMADYCWGILRDCTNTFHSSKSRQKTCCVSSDKRVAKFDNSMKYIQQERE